MRTTSRWGRQTLSLIHIYVMSKIVILVGSPRRDGNTQALAGAFAAGARGRHQVELCSVADYLVHPCTGCNACAAREGNRCVQQDDMQQLYPCLLYTSGKTMGIIGFGSIGKKVGALAKCLGMRVLAAGSRPTEEGRAIGEYVDLDTLFRESDVISLHCPLFPENRELICNCLLYTSA